MDSDSPLACVLNYITVMVCHLLYYIVILCYIIFKLYWVGELTPDGFSGCGVPVLMS